MQPSPSRLRRVLPEPTGPATALPLYATAASRQLEAGAAAGLPAHTLMQRAGHAVARLAQAVAPHAGRITVIAGPGNNGGDGFEAAMHLRQAGRVVHVCFLGDAARLPADAGAALAAARAAGVSIDFAGHCGSLADDSAEPDDLVIDALLGRGLGRPVTGVLAAAVGQINRSRARVLSIDLPSGLPADTGAPAPGAMWVQAHTTLALLSLAPGLFTAQGRDAAGEIWWDDLGVSPSPGAAWQPAPVAWLAASAAVNAWARPRRHAQHKGSFGDVRIIGGAPNMTGAALLAGRAALRAGAGRVYLHWLDPQAPRLDAVCPELMFAPPPEPGHLTAQTTVLAGCGGGAEIVAMLPLVIGQAQRLVLDADALNALAAEPDLQLILRGRAARAQATVLTPHPLEAARLLAGASTSVTTVQADRLAAAQALADYFNAVVVLKGSGSVIAAPGETPWINPTGHGALAVPGSGDVLAGWLAGLWSPRGPDALSAVQAARRAVYLHGQLAERLSPAGAPLSASHLADSIQLAG